MIEITNENMLNIFKIIENELSKKNILEIVIPNPDLGSSYYAGTSINSTSKHHSWRAWNDLATLLHSRVLTPRILSNEKVILRIEKLNQTDSFHINNGNNIKEEKYGTDSVFSKIDKNEEPAFVYAYSKALKQVNISNRESVLDLGINSGDEFLVIKNMLTVKEYKNIKLIGIDHSLSAISKAKEIFQQQNKKFYCHDINKLENLNLPKFDLIISIGTLQSPNIKFKTFFMSLVQNYLISYGAIILGFPNSRWIDGEMVYGAKIPNYSFSEMSVVIKDIYFCKKYLQQHKFRVTITGKEYLFLTATKIKY